MTSVELVIDFSFFDLGGLTPRPKVTKREDDLQSTKIYHPTIFQPDRANGLRDMRHQSFSLFGPWGLTPAPKFAKRGNDLAEAEVYHPAKSHRSTSTHARDIRYQISADKKTNKQ